MSLKAPLHPEYMIPNSMEIYVGAKWSDALTHVGFYKDPSLASASESTDDTYANGTIKKSKDWKKVTVSFSAHELSPDLLGILQSWLVQVLPWTVSWEVEKFEAWSWGYEKDILLKFANANGTAVTITSITALIEGSEVSLTADTDYQVWATSFGATYVKLLMKDTEHTSRKLEEDSPEKVRLTVTYSATNGTSKVIDHFDNAIAKPFVMVLVNEYVYDGNTKTVKMYVDNCQANKAMLQQISDSDNTTVGFPVEITWDIVSQEFAGFVASSGS